MDSSPRPPSCRAATPLPIELWILATLGFIPRRGAHRAGGGKIRLLLPGEALTGLEVERSVSVISCSQERGGEIRLGISCSQERRSPGWRWKDPSRGFLAPSKAAHRAGGGKIRLGPGNISLLGSGAHRAGGGKIRPQKACKNTQKRAKERERMRKGCNQTSRKNVQKPTG